MEMKWEFHTPWHPQSSGWVERMNGEIKKQLTKLMLETKMSRVKCLSLALLNIQTQPRTDTGISPFEMLYGMPHDMEHPAYYPSLEGKTINSYIVELMKTTIVEKRTSSPEASIGDSTTFGTTRRYGFGKDLEGILPHPSMGRTISCFTYHRNHHSDRRIREDTHLQNQGPSSPGSVGSGWDLARFKGYTQKEKGLKLRISA